MRLRRLEFVTGSLLVCLGLLGPGCGGEDDDAAEEIPRPLPYSQTGALLDLRSGSEVAGSTITLDRRANGVDATIAATGLIPDHVYTVWWVFFNNSAECVESDTAPFCGPGQFASPDLVNAAQAAFGYAGPKPMGGAIADASGEISFPKLVFNSGDELTYAFLYGTYYGLTSPEEAEIHVMLRDHGLPLEGADLEPQLSEFNGGCKDATNPDRYECYDAFGTAFVREIAP